MNLIYRNPGAAIVMIAVLWFSFLVYSFLFATNDCSALFDLLDSGQTCVAPLTANRFGGQHTGFWIAFSSLAALNGIAIASWQNFKIKRREFTLNEVAVFIENEEVLKRVSVMYSFPEALTIENLSSYSQKYPNLFRDYNRAGGLIANRLEHVATCVLAGDLEEKFIRDYLSDYMIWIAPFVCQSWRAEHDNFPAIYEKLEVLYHRWFGLPASFQNWTDDDIKRVRDDRRANQEKRRAVLRKMRG